MDSVVTLTRTGGVITDLVRIAALDGDGRAPEGSYGIWDAATNFEPNSQAAVNTSGWNDWNGGGGTVARSTTEAKFGATSVQANFGASVNSMIGRGTSLSVAPSGVIALTVWVKGPAGFRVAPRIRERTAADAFIVDQTGPTVTLTGDWQKITLTVTIGATTALIRYGLGNVTGTAQTCYMQIQLETGKPTPYIPTSGATAARAVPRVRAPSSVLAPTAGWIAFRARAGYVSGPTGIEATLNPTGFAWNDGTVNNLIRCSRILNGWRLRRTGAGVTSNIDVAQAFVPDDLMTVCCVWAAAQLRLSVNGAPFAVVANSFIPVGLSTLFDIGRDTGLAAINGDMLWFGASVPAGIPTDADAALLHARLAAGLKPRNLADLPWSFR